MLEPLSARSMQPPTSSEFRADAPNRLDLSLSQQWPSWSADAMETPIQEAHHRIKNSLQLVVSMLSLQARSGGPAAGALQEAARRVGAVARLHAHLQTSETETKVGDLLNEVVADLSQAASCRERNIRIGIDTDDLELESEQAATLALIANELVTNCLKHACPRGGETILVRFARGETGYRLSVSDQGPGFPKSATERGGSLGLMLVRSMVRRLNGTLEILDAQPGVLVVVDVRE